MSRRCDATLCSMFTQSGSPKQRFRQEEDPRDSRLHPHSCRRWRPSSRDHHNGMRDRARCPGVFRISTLEFPIEYIISANREDVEKSSTSFIGREANRTHNTFFKNILKCWTHLPISNRVVRWCHHVPWDHCRDCAPVVIPSGNSRQRFPMRRRPTSFQIATSSLCVPNVSVSSKSCSSQAPWRPLKGDDTSS